MKYIVLILLSLIAVIRLSADNLDKLADKTVITVGNEKVPLRKFRYFYDKNSAQRDSDMTADEYADIFALYRMKVLEARSIGLDTAAANVDEFNSYKAEVIKPYLINDSLAEELVEEIYRHMAREVNVSHIMQPLGRSEAEAAHSRHLLDSLRNVLAQGGDFPTIAKQYSIDRAASMNGGNMGFIQANRLPYTFEKAAYETPVGDVSEVFATPFGYHIVKVNGVRDSRGEVLVRHILKLTQGKTPEEAQAARMQIYTIYDALKNGADFGEVAREESEDPGSKEDGGMLPWFGAGRMVPQFEEVAFSLRDGEMSEPFPTSYGFHIIQRLDSKGVPELEEVRPQIEAMIKRDHRARMPYESEIVRLGHLYGLSGSDDSIMTPELERAVIETHDSVLSAENPEYRYLLEEYMDGIILFELADRKVWAKAFSDADGLQRFFVANKERYKWDAPRFKGYIAYTSNDSVYTALKDMTLNRDMDAEKLADSIKSTFGRSVKVEKVIAEKGKNAIIDNEIFGVSNSSPVSPYKYYIILGGRIIDSPEEASDVRRELTEDYENSLQSAWESELKAKYPIKKDKGLLRKLDNVKN